MRLVSLLLFSFRIIIIIIKSSMFTIAPLLAKPFMPKDIKNIIDLKKLCLQKRLKDF